MSRTRLVLGGIVAALLCMPIPSHAASSRCDPVTYGARHDGRTNDGPAIQRAITACSEAGGGMVSLTSGTWLERTFISQKPCHAESGAGKYPSGEFGHASIPLGLSGESSAAR